jgi:hypothetical protein
MRRFDACALCLQRARDPVACQEGHLFCKECAYTDLCEFIRSQFFSGCQTRSVAQKKDIKRQKERLEALTKEAEQEKLKAKEAARERVLAEFEKGQLGLAAVASVTTSGIDAPGNWVYPCYSGYNLLHFQAVEPSENSLSILQRRKSWLRKQRRQHCVKSSVNRLQPYEASCPISGCPR